MLCGFVAIIFAIIVITSIDKYKERTKKEELEAIDKQINERAHKIAEQKVLEYLDKMSK